MKTLLPICFLVSFLCGSVLPCFGGMGSFYRPSSVAERREACIKMYGPVFCTDSIINPQADGTGVLYGGGFQSSPLANPSPAPGGFMDYRMDYGGIFPGQNFMRAQGGCIHSCGWLTNLLYNNYNW